MATEWQDHGPLQHDRSHRFTYRSAATDVDLEVTVALPAFYEGLAEPRPTLYVLDGNLTFLMAAPIVQSYELLAIGQFPSLAVVGIGYADPNPMEIMSRRMLDLSPTASAGSAEITAQAVAAARHGLGGGAAFQAALRDEIIPEVESRFRLDPADRTLAGWSLGGLFGLQVLFSEPSLFRRYVLVSPSIWWDDRHILEREEAWAAAHDDLPAEVFLAAGDREETAPSRSWPPMPAELAGEAQMVSNLHRLAERLHGRGYRSLQLTTAVLEEEHHSSVFPAGLGLGLRRLHGGLR
jgi:uncharacterized protein